ncbi:MAG: DUF5794 domain-containing protein [Halobacteriales archaeon]
MSNSQHPIAVRLEERVGNAIRLLATVMGLPLVDGIFPALVLAGALETAGGVLQVGLLVFAGSATVAVVLAEMGETPRSQAPQIAALGVVLVAVAVVEAALAPAIGSALDLVVFERFAALVILAVAASTTSARICEFLPRPAIIVGLGLVASVDPAGASLALSVDPGLVARGAAAAGVGIGFALLLAFAAPTLRGLVDIDRFRFGSAVALGTLSLSVLGLVPGNAPLAVLAVSALLAYDPGGADLADLGGEDAALADGGDDDSGSSAPERDPWL